MVWRASTEPAQHRHSYLPNAAPSPLALLAAQGCRILRQHSAKDTVPKTQSQ